LLAARQQGQPPAGRAAQRLRRRARYAVAEHAMHIKRFFGLARQAVNAWLDDYAPSMGAAIAFYTVFSLAPLVIIVIAVAGFFWGREAVQGQLFDQINALVGADGAKAVESVVQGAQEPTQGIVATVISIVVLAVGATTVFAELQSALDRIWKVDLRKQSGIWNMIRARLLSFGLVLTLAFLLIISLMVSAVLAALGGWAGGIMPGWEALLQVANVVVTLAILTLLFAMIFRFLPKASVAWHDVWTGAFVTAVLFEIGKFLIGLYVGKASVASSYAAAGSLVVVLIWVYYAAQVFLLGAEFTWVYANAHGSHRSAAPPVSGPANPASAANAVAPAARR
jgi:membrane protein